MSPPRIIVGISGATGIVFGIRALQVLRELGIETHLVVSKAAEQTRAYETDLSHEALIALADVAYHPHDIGAAIASGSFQTMGMLVAPCSVKTLAQIAHGTGDSLLARAADVVLKERRKLVLMVREAPLHSGHLRNMLAVTEMGGIIHPPVLGFYTRPQTIADLVDHTLSRVLDAFGLTMPQVPRWGEPAPDTPAAEAP